MVFRLCLALILIVFVTASVKSWAFKKKARFLTPGLAHQFFVETRLAQGKEEFSKDSKNHPKDGWGNPFYWQASSRLLFSAGKDERFHTPDDLYFAWIHSNCPPSVRDWIFEHAQQKGWDLGSLPAGSTWQAAKFAVRSASGICPLPDLSGPDGLSETGDDVKSVRFLEPGKRPEWREVQKQLKK